MKLVKNNYTIHAINPDKFDTKGRFKRLYLSFCGLAGYHRDFDLYEGSSDTVTCKTCKKLMQKYIIRKLKNEVV